MNDGTAPNPAALRGWVEVRKPSLATGWTDADRRRCFDRFQGVLSGGANSPLKESM
jgi:hypothetical protein